MVDGSDNGRDAEFEALMNEGRAIQSGREIEVEFSGDPHQPQNWPTPSDRARTLGGVGTQLPTVIDTLNQATRGGPRTGKVVVIGGAPGAGKTTLLVQQAMAWAEAGYFVGFLASDEDAEGLLIRCGQIIGIQREALENGTAAARLELADHLETLPNFLLLDADADKVSLEEVSTELARRADGKPSILAVDSIQTTRVLGIEAADSKRARVDMVMLALKRAAKQGHLVVATCELARGAYRSKNTAEQIDDLAAFKESGDIEYGTTVAMVMRSVPNISNLVDVSMAKNRLGQKLPFRIELSPDSATFREIVVPNEEQDSPIEQVKRKVLDLIRKAVVPIESKSEIQRRIKLRRATVWAAIDELLEEARLTQVGGRFGLPDPPISGSTVPGVPNRSGNATRSTVPPPLGGERGSGTAQNGLDSGTGQNGNREPGEDDE